MLKSRDGICSTLFRSLGAFSEPIVNRSLMYLRTVARLHFSAPVLVILATLTLGCAGCGKRPPDPSAGNAAFFAGDYQGAVSRYREAFGPQPDDPSVSSRMAIAQFMLGTDYPAFIESFNHYVRTSGELDRFQPVRAALQVLRSDKFGGLEASNAESPFLSGRDIPHFMQMRLLSQLARRITQGKSGDAAKAQALMDWVLRNVRPAPDERDGDPPADPWSIVMRGYGVCDRGAWVLVTLAQQAGLRAHILYLRNPDDPALPSPHTLATIRMDGRWALADTYGGFWLRDGEHDFLTLEDILARPEALQPILEADPSYPLQPRWFLKAMWYLTFVPQALLPRMKLLQQILQKELPENAGIPILSQDLPGEVIQALTPTATEDAMSSAFRFPYTFPGREDQADLWPYPFQLARKAAPGFEYYRGLPEEQAQNRRFREARFHQLLGNGGRALPLYDSLIEENGPIAEAARFFSALCRLDPAQEGGSADGIRAYIEKFPAGEWRDQALLLLGLHLLERGEREEAESTLKRVEGPRRWAARMARKTRPQAETP